MKILITGINGFIAQPLIEKLNQENYKIYGLDIQNESSTKIEKYYKIDISEAFQIDEEFDCIIHLAAFNRTNIDSNHDYNYYYKINVLGTKNVACCCKYKKFIFMSSASIYDKNTEFINEESKINPMGNYAKSKWDAEKILADVVPREKLIIIRASNVVGLNQKKIAMIPVFFSKAIQNEEINIFVPSNRTIQLLDVCDLTRVFVILLNNNINGIYNLAPETGIEIKDLAEQIKSICNSNSYINISNDQIEKKALISSAVIKSKINWKAERDLQSILKDYYYHLLENNN